MNGQPRKKFRVTSTWFIITVSQCNLNHVEVFDAIMSADGVKRAVVASEHHHETDGVHIHAFVEFTTRRGVQDGQKFYSNWVGINPSTLLPYLISFSIPQRGDGQTQDAAIKYCMKDGNWVSSFDAGALLRGSEPGLPEAKRSKVWVQILDRLKQGEDHVRLLFDEELGPTVARELVKVQAVETVVVSTADANMRAQWPADLQHPLFRGFHALLGQDGPYAAQGPAAYQAADQILRWLVINLQPRKPGQLQLVIAGPTSNQKSALVTAISRWLSVAWWNRAENRNDTAYQNIDDRARLLCVDEYDKDSIPGPLLLRILADTSQVQFRRFHQAGLVTGYALPVILLTNQLYVSSLVPDGFSAEQADAYRRRVNFVAIPPGSQDFLLPVVQWIEYCGRSFNRGRRNAMNVPFPYVCPPCCSAIELPPPLETAGPTPVIVELAPQTVTFN